MEEIFQHFRKEEQQFIEQVSGWLREVEDRYSPKLTDFLDPRQRFIVEAVVGSSEVKMMSSGIFKDAERQRVLLYPAYFEPQQEDFNTTVFELKYPSKFVNLPHPASLGSLISFRMDR